MAYLAGIDRATLQRWFLSKTAEIEFIDFPFREALIYLTDVSAANIWPDPAVILYDAKLTITTRGQWLDVLDRVLAKTPFESALFEDGIVWIGPPDKRKDAEQRQREMAALAGNHPVLQGPADVEFIDVPFRDGWTCGCKYDVSIQLLGEIDQLKEIDRVGSWTPFYLELEVITEMAGVDWGMLGETIVMAPENEYPHGKTPSPISADIRSRSRVSVWPTIRWGRHCKNRPTSSLSKHRHWMPWSSFPISTIFRSSISAVTK